MNGQSRNGDDADEWLETAGYIIVKWNISNGQVSLNTQNILMEIYNR